MKTFLILITLLFPLNTNRIDQSALIKIRNMIVAAADSKEANLKLKAFLASYQDQGALINGYKGASVMIEAKHMMNPLNRWSKFKEGKVMMEEAIKADYKNYELRFLRHSIQTNVPSVLGYSGEIETDKKFLVSGLMSLKDEDLKNRVYKFLLASKTTTKEDLKKLKQWKNK